jgi:16S rRNA (uracil1498-N3)-methyltransferase
MITRCFYPGHLEESTEIEIEDDEHHHLSRVLRAKEEDEIEVVNGRGSLAKARVKEIDKKKSTLWISSIERAEATIQKRILAVPFMRSSKLEWVIEKCTELGADGFCIYRAEKSTQPDISEHQQKRLRLITISALKQSKRLFLPSIEIISSIEMIAHHDLPLFYGDPEARASFEQGAPALVVTGPESGFSKKEEAFLKKRGKGIRLNPNVLRAETAPIAAMSILNA